MPEATVRPEPSRLAAELQVVVACTFDSSLLDGPLQVWLTQLTGQRCALKWVGYGSVLPTLCDFAGIDVPATVEGTSMRAVLEGRAETVRESLRRTADACSPA